MSNFSWIQYYILGELAQHSVRRYSQLRPADVEGNLFSYHLKGLLGEGLVEKTDGAYQLTAKGLQLISTLSLAIRRPRRQPQILNAIVCRNEAGAYLMSTWHRQPNRGLVSFPHGMMHYGESILDMAAQELAEKAGLRGELRYRGDVYVRAYRAGQLDRHMLVHIFEATHVEADHETQRRPEASESSWMDLDRVDRKQFVPGFYEIAELVRQAEPQEFIFADIAVDVVAP